MIEEENEHVIVAFIVDFTSRSLEFPFAGCQILTYFLHEDKKLINLLNMNLFFKKSPEVEI